MKVFNAFMNSGIKIPQLTLVTDRDFGTACTLCGESQTLNLCSTLTNGDVTHYKCKNHCEKDILLVYKFGSLENKSGHAYRLGDYVVKCHSDLFIILPDGVAVQFPK